MCGTPHTYATDNDNHSQSLMQLSFRSPAWPTEASLDTIGETKTHEKTSATAEARQWGLWHEDTGTDVPEESDNYEAVAQNKTFAAPYDQPGMPQGHFQTSLNTEAVSEVYGTIPVLRYAKSTPPRLRSRLFMQSAMDLSFASREWGRPVQSSPEIRPKSLCIFSSVGGGSIERDVPGIGKYRPKTSSAELNQSRYQDVKYGGGYCQERALKHEGKVHHSNRPISVPIGLGGGSRRKTEAQQERFIDLGVVGGVAISTVWDNTKMAAAAAAASGKTAVSEGGWGNAIVSKGGVVLDVRLAKLRKTLRSEVLDAAERAKLPLLQ